MKRKFAFVVALVMVLQLSLFTLAFAEDDKGVEIMPVNKKVTDATQKLIDNRPLTKRPMDYLDRGLVAVKIESGVFLSWRWLGTESVNVIFDLYRDGKKINPMPLTVTNYTDIGADVNSKYYVIATLDGVEQDKSKEVIVWNENAITLNLDIPKPWTSPKDEKEYKYKPSDTSAADLDGDGEYELIILLVAVACDNSQGVTTSPPIYQSYKLNGKKLWEINCGVNIRAGAHYNDFMVFDINEDGKAEMMIKTADGTIDGKGKVIGDANANYVNGGGWILEGPEFLTVFNGETGAAIQTVDYHTPRGNVADWGDSYGNRLDRYLGCAIRTEYNGTPVNAIVMCRGYYTRATMAAYTLIDNKLVKVWSIDSNDKGNELLFGAGNHGITVADVDYDGFDEIVYGAAAVDHNGKFMYRVEGVGHGDAQHTGDLLPSRPGLETYSVHEGGAFMFDMRDTRTGDVIWKANWGGGDNGRGASDDVDPRYAGAESWSAGFLKAADGTVIAKGGFAIPQNYFAYWDGDLGREIQDGNHIDKFNTKTLKTNNVFTAKDCTSINGTKSTPCLNADLFGDWREETIYPTKDGTKLKIFTTTIPSDYRIYTLMHNPEYRMAVIWENVGYNQPPHVDFNLGYSTKQIPIPYVSIKKDGKEISNPDLTDSNAKNHYDIERLTQPQSTSLSLAIGVNKAIKGSKALSIDASNPDVAPIIKDGRTLVPARFISEALGATVDWNESTQGITITKDDKTIKMTLDSTNYTVANVSKKFDVPAQSINGRTMIPLRAMAEALDKKVAWDSQGLIYISDKDTTLEKDGVASYIETIKNAPLPVVKVAPTIFDNVKLLPNQIQIVKVDAKSNDGNTPEGAVDGDLITRWSDAAKDTWLQIDFADVKDVKAIAAAHWNGTNRVYKFDILTSTDGINWTKVMEKVENSGTSDGLELHTFPAPVKAKHIKILGYGSNVNSYTHISEIVAIEAK